MYSKRCNVHVLSVFQEHVYQDCQSRYSKQEILHQTYINFCMYRYMFKYFRSSPI